MKKNLLILTTVCLTSSVVWGQDFFNLLGDMFSMSRDGDNYSVSTMQNGVGIAFEQNASGQVTMRLPGIDDEGQMVQIGTDGTVRNVRSDGRIVSSGGMGPNSIHWMYGDNGQIEMGISVTANGDMYFYDAQKRLKMIMPAGEGNGYANIKCYDKAFCARIIKQMQEADAADAAKQKNGGWLW